MFAHGLVVRIEEEIVARMKRTITRTVFSEKKCFEEPSRVGEMPFGRAAIGHCLKLKILDLQRLTKFFRLLANTPIFLETSRAQHEITSGSLIASVRRVTCRRDWKPVAKAVRHPRQTRHLLREDTTHLDFHGHLAIRRHDHCPRQKLRAPGPKKRTE